MSALQSVTRVSRKPSAHWSRLARAHAVFLLLEMLRFIPCERGTLFKSAHFAGCESGST